MVGCGSIGSRRARLLAEMGHEVGLVDADATRSHPLFVELAIRYVDDGRAFHFRGTLAGAMLEPWDAVFVCTPAGTHLAVAREVIEAGCRGLFIEKPLSTSIDGVAELVADCEARGVVTMGACNMRWAYGPIPAPGDRETIYADCMGPLSAWGPGHERYRANGIVLESLIHEIDLCAWVAGPITEIMESEVDDDSR